MPREEDSRDTETTEAEEDMQPGALSPLHCDTTERSPLPVVYSDGQRHIVRYVNPAFCHLVGKAAEELIGRPFALAVPEGETNGCLALLDHVYQTGTSETLADQEHTLAPAGSSSDTPAASASAFGLSPLPSTGRTWPGRFTMHRSIRSG